jgi:hypothetical protein
MFYVLCITLCLAVMFIVIAGAGVFCIFCSRFLRPLVRSATPRTAANLLFTIRTLPILSAFLVTFGFALPAFLKFEPRSTSELMGSQLFGLAALGAFVLSVIAIRGTRMAKATMVAQRHWRIHSKKLHIEGVNIPLYCVEDEPALLAVSGVFQPKIFVGRQIVETLSASELSAALTHETAHVRSFDNLKQLLLRITRPPRWLNIFRMADVQWTSASEIAADEAALASGASVLDLSSALVKVGRLNHDRAVPDMVIASHLLPVPTAMEMRVMHLQRLLEEDSRLPRQVGRPGRKYMRYVPLVVLLSYGACVNAALPWIHEALEFLVR